MFAVEERAQADLAGARDAGLDVSVILALRVLAKGLGGLELGLGGQAADQKTHSAVEVVNDVDYLLGGVADVRERLVLESVSDLGDAGEIPAAVVDDLEVLVEIIV